jgi:predicted HicB family RNase H-like nuclease
MSMTTLKYNGYFGSVEYSQEDKLLYGKIECINDLIMFETTDATQLQTVFEEAVDDYLATCKEIGKVPDKTFSGTFNVRVEPALHKALHIEGVNKGVSLNAIMTEAIQQYLSKVKMVPLSHLTSRSANAVHIEAWGRIQEPNFTVKHHLTRH